MNDTYAAENMYDAWDNGDRHEIRQQFARREEIIRMAREQGLPETATEGVFIVNSDDLGRMLAAERERLEQPEQAWITAGPHTAPLRTHWEGCEEVHPECKRPATREEKIVNPGVYEVPVAPPRPRGETK